MSSPLFSLIVTVYNAEKTIYKCLESVKMQSFHNFECIVVNDGSIDESGNIIKSFLKDRRFLYLFQQNKGTSQATNLAISHAIGEYIVILDHDDWLDRKCLEYTEFLVKTYDKPDIIQYGANYFLEDGQFSKKSLLRKLSVWKCKDAVEEELNVNYEYYFIAHNSKAIKRTLFNGINYSGDGYGADTFLMHKICSRVGSIVYSDKYLYNFTELKTSISRRGKPDSLIIDNYYRSLELLSFYQKEIKQKKHFIGTKIIWDSYTNAILYMKRRNLNNLFRFRLLLLRNYKMFIKKPSVIILWSIAPYIIKLIRKK